MTEGAKLEKAKAVAAKIEIVAKQTGKTTDQVLSEARDAAGIGHNSGEPKDVAGTSGERIRTFMNRIQRLEEEKSSIAEDIKEIYSEIKAAGFETKIIRKIVQLEKMDAEKRREEEELLDLYKSAIGMI